MKAQTIREDRERLRKIIRNLIKPLDGIPLNGVSLVTMTIDKRVIADARAALGAGENPTGEGVGE